MFNSKFNNVLTVLLVIAIIGIVALIGYFGWSVYNKYYLNASAHEVVESFEQNVGNKKEEEEEGERQPIGDVESGNSIYVQSSENKNVNKYYGYNVIGTISIPSIKIEYPILDKATAQSIKVAVAYLSGARN